MHVDKEKAEKVMQFGIELAPDVEITVPALIKKFTASIKIDAGLMNHEHFEILYPIELQPSKQRKEAFIFTANVLLF